MSVIITHSAEPLTEEDIARAEDRMGRSVPLAYRNFLLAHNGGRPQPDGFRAYGKNGELEDGSYVKWFFGINTGEYYSSLEDKLATYRRRMPSNLLPIASDPGGNVVCLSANGPDAGSVYFWHHEFETQPPTYDNVWFVAPSFDEFINGLQDLHEVEDEHEE